MNEKIDKLIDICLRRKMDEAGVFYWDTTEGKIYQREEMRSVIRQVLGIDKQCSQCLSWKFDAELKVIETTDSLVCEECAEAILAGKQELKL